MSSIFGKATSKKTNSVGSIESHIGIRNTNISTIEIHKHHLFPDPEQPRKWFDSTVIDRRKNQLISEGQVSPITVLPGVLAEDGLTRYQIVDGECRWRAVMNSTEIDYLRAQIYQGNPQDEYARLISQLIHNNDGSEKLLPIERAATYQRLISQKKSLGVHNPQDQVAKDIGMDKGEFSRLISLNNMPPFVEDFVLSHGISDTKALNGIMRVAKLASESNVRSLFFDIERNEKIKAQGGETKPLRTIVQDAVADAKARVAYSAEDEHSFRRKMNTLPA